MSDFIAAMILFINASSGLTEAVAFATGAEHAADDKSVAGGALAQAFFAGVASRAVSADGGMISSSRLDSSRS